MNNFLNRIERARELAQAHDLGGLVFGPSAELAYLTGAWEQTHERFSGLVIPNTGDAVYIAPMVDKESLQVPVPILGWEDGRSPYALVKQILGTPKTIGVGSELTAAHLLAIQDELGTTARLATPLLAELFMRKDPTEIEQLAAAGRAIDSVHEQVPGLLVPGRTESEVATDIHRLILEAGHSAVDFVIVGSGPNGANPHHSYSDRVLQDGDVVVVDIGGTWGDGYHSDCTRTYFLGQQPDWYQVLREAQELAVAAVRPGATAALIDATARDHIAAAGYGDFFTHRTGHGIGLSLHEEPFIMAGNDLVLEPGMTFSVEPGIYLPGECGARIEDIVVVTEEGVTRLNQCRIW